MGYVPPALTIVCGIVCTTALQASDGFSRLGPSLLVVAGYGLAFFLLALVLRAISLGGPRHLGGVGHRARRLAGRAVTSKVRTSRPCPAWASS
ncbi:SMR family transporter [Pseudodesulfovibrio methanolicus]|uniref:SMR family transporter n=1 Tax=Pseudodesulfovibrio methanolicus TaxID=3126690 RepID=A0ABZ2IZU4_9BACT